VRLCHIWGDVRYLHPSVVSGVVDWDAALEAALPAALSATTDDEEAAAVGVLLGVLHDTATYVERDSSGLGAVKPRTTSTRTIDGVLVATIAASSWGDAEATSRRLSGELAVAKLAVLDIRVPSSGLGWPARLVLSGLAPTIVSHDGAGLVARGVEHIGYRPQSGPSGGYSTVFTAYAPELYLATNKPHPAHVVVVANEASRVPDVAWAMQRSGDATIVVQGHLARDEFSSPRIVPLGEGWSAHLRQTFVSGPEPQPDVTLSADLAEAQVREAVLRAAHHVAPPRGRAVALPPPEPSWRPDATYASSPYPSRERRLLALFRFWNVIERFYPYLTLMGDTWDRALVEFLPRFELAADARQYALAVAELAARIPDGHVHVTGSPEVDRVLGSARPPFEVQVLGGQVVVTSLSQKSPPPGILPGDVIVTVAGEPMDAAMERVSPYIAGSNEAYVAYRAAGAALAGELGESLTVTVRDAAGATHDVSMPRTKEREPRRAGPVYRLVDGDVGYADLDRLEVGDVDAMFSAFEKTRAIVFDMRGYPHNTGPAIAQRLNVRHVGVAAQFFEPFVAPGAAGEVAPRRFFGQALPQTEQPQYRGKTVMLIDERTISQAEHVGLLLEAANGTTFIGSQTAGADGDVTRLVLPAGISVSFTGRDVRHADGRQLQRTGLVPDLVVRPTVEGIRAGRDEVLEQALATIKSAP
jgi:C-terminal processing protease CtpA/Prc